MASITVPIAIAGAGALGAGASLYGASTQAGAAKNAANLQAAAANRGIDLQRDMFGVVQNNLMPYMNVGGEALGQLASLTGVGGSNDRQIAQLQAELKSLGYVPPTPMMPGQQTPGVAAALQGGTHSQGTLENNLIDPLGLFRTNASPLQDIAGALKKGLPVTASDWLKAGFGPNGEALGAAGGAGSPGGAPNPNQARIDEILAQVKQLQSTNTMGNPLTAPLTAKFNPTMEQLEQTPGYQFARDQGLRAMVNRNTSTGGGGGGNELGDIGRFATGLASQTYQQQFQNYWTQNQNIYDMLSGLTTMGQNSAAGVGSAALKTGGTIADLIGAQGNALAAGQVGSAGAIAGGLNSAATGIGNTGLLYAMSQNGLFGNPAANAGSTPLAPVSNLNSWAGPDNYFGGTAVG